MGGIYIYTKGSYHIAPGATSPTERSYEKSKGFGRLSGTRELARRLNWDGIKQDGSGNAADRGSIKLLTMMMV